MNIQIKATEQYICCGAVYHALHGGSNFLDYGVKKISLTSKEIELTNPGY